MKEQSQELNMILAIVNGDVTTASEFAKLFSIPITQAIHILNDQVFLNAVSQFTKADANIFFHQKAIPELINQIRSGEIKNILPAIKMLGQYVGDFKSSQVDVNISIPIERRLESNEPKTVEGREIKSLPVPKDNVIDLIPESIKNDFDWLDLK